MGEGIKINSAPGFGSQAVARSQTARLRLLATTDLHMHLLAYDYYNDHAVSGIGLVGLSQLIASERADGIATILVDNGDSLHGNPMGDRAALRRNMRLHPLIAEMNRLGYDAATLGNHDFNHGAGFAATVARGAFFPIVLSNVEISPPHKSAFAPWAMITRDMGDCGALTIGVLGFLPPQTTAWNPALSHEMQLSEIDTAARRLIPVLKAAGANLIVALCHSGIGSPTPAPGMENAATALAALDGIDAVVAGHTHQVFPGPSIPATPGVDPVKGTLAGKPAVMPGFWGSHLGVIEFDLIRAPVNAGADGAHPRWRIAQAKSRVARPSITTSAVAALPDTLNLHGETLTHMRHRVGRSTGRLTNWFCAVGYDPALRLVGQALRHHLTQALGHDRPILVAVAPYRAGGRGGPQHFVDIAPGPISRRDLWSLYPYDNGLSAVEITGAGLRDWLERAAARYQTVGQDHQALIAPSFPSYNFDLPLGVTWRWDLSRPALYHPDSSLTHQEQGRVVSLTYGGKEIRDDDRFILGVNAYRRAAGGPFAGLVENLPLCYETKNLCRRILHRYISRVRRVSVADDPLFLLTAPRGSSATFLTATQAVSSLALASGTKLVDQGLDPEGFAQIRITF